MATRIPGKVYINPGNDTLIRPEGLFYYDPTDATLTKHYFDNTAVVTATLYDQYNNPVVGCINEPLAFVTGTQGIFAGVVQAFNPPLGTGYTLGITATQGAADADFSIDAEVTLRMN